MADNLYDSVAGIGLGLVNLPAIVHVAIWFEHKLLNLASFLTMFGKCPFIKIMIYSLAA